MPSLQQLEYIVAVGDHRHFGRAAESCHISQPTLSQQILKVEETLGLTLFDRLKKPVVATPRGAIFLEQARKILFEHRRLKFLAADAGADTSGVFRVAVLPTVASALVPLFLDSFSSQFPKVDLHLHEMTTRTILDELREDRIDVAIMATPLEEDGFRQEPLYYEPFMLYLSRNHPLLKKKTLRPEDLEESQLWSLRDGHCFKEQVAIYCSLPATNLKLRNVHFQSGSLETLVSIVRQGRGYTMIPALMAELLDTREARASVRGFNKPTPCREISLVYRREHARKSLVDGLRSAIQAALPASVFPVKGSDLEVLGFGRC